MIRINTNQAISIMANIIADNINNGDVHRAGDADKN